MAGEQMVVCEESESAYSEWCPQRVFRLRSRGHPPTASRDPGFGGFQFERVSGGIPGAQQVRPPPVEQDEALFPNSTVSRVARSD